MWLKLENSVIFCERTTVTALTALICLTLASCAKSTQGGASQVVAKVNNDEITVFELNAALSHVSSLTPENRREASAQLLKQLVDEDLLVQKARQAKLDRNPGVVQAVEAAKRSILATAWIQQIAAAVPQPSNSDVNAYFTQHPEYFSDRRVYEYRSIPIKATPAQVADIERQLAANKDVEPLLGNLRTNKVVFVVNEFVKGAEQLPAQVLAKFTALRDGEVVTFPYSEGIEVVQMLRSRPEPVDETQAKPFIQKYLLEEARKQRGKQELEALRSSAKIEYIGDMKALQAGQTAPVPTPAAPHSQGDVTKGIGLGIK